MGSVVATFISPVEREVPVEKIVEKEVKPFRQRAGNTMGRETWWLFYRAVLKLYRTIAPLKKVMLRSLTSKHHTITFVETNIVIDQTIASGAMVSISSACIGLSMNIIPKKW